MSLAGRGAVAIWHDIAPEGRVDFYAWHGGEHMPERLSIPGFLRGRRFAALDADLEFFNLYETADAAVVKGAEYRARVDNPTPRTLAAVRHFRSTARSLCEVGASFGGAQGGICATWRYDVAEARAEAHTRVLTDHLLPKAAALPGVAGVHFLRADAEASGRPTAEQIARGVANTVPQWIIILEGWGDAGGFAALCGAAVPGGALESLGALAPPVRGIYQLQIARGRTGTGV